MSLKMVGFHLAIFVCLVHNAVAEERGRCSHPLEQSLRRLLRHSREKGFIHCWDHYKTLRIENPFTSVVRNTLISTARSCMTHVNATETDLEHLREDPPFPEKAACIIECLLEKIGIVKNKKYSKSGFMMAISPLVFTHKKKLEHMNTVGENCDREINHHNIEVCQLGNEVTTCIFKYAPELHLKA